MDQALIVRRWRRYGADRLFVMGDTGVRVGCVDLQSGEVVVDLPDHEEELRRAAQVYLRGDAQEVVLPLPRDGADGDLVLPLPPLDVTERPRGTPARESVPARLDRLVGLGWHVVSGVPLGRQGNVVDHLLIGPGGLYAISVHEHPGEEVRVEKRVLEVGGRRVGYLRDAGLQAARVRSLLTAAVGAPVHVRGAVVLDGVAEVRSTTVPDEALVLTRQDVPAVFRLLVPRLTASQVLTLVAAARSRATWKDSPKATWGA